MEVHQSLSVVFEKCEGDSLRFGFILRSLDYFNRQSRVQAGLRQVGTMRWSETYLIAVAVVVVVTGRDQLR